MEKRKSEARVSTQDAVPLLALRMEEPQRRNEGLWQSLRDRQGPLLTAGKRTGTSNNSGKEMGSVHN